ncbi:hypothetical protein [Nesterenkonia jeotgali]|uniref:Uncharacterized protein n=1 Tax=Nesterenkonia jeotgali TaxID=317018 RepID=A0A0W8IIG7_9MICC|nr:hypothetical protein [Nesterenkonia jeotgali]KUG59656.1 hypothetical protein AVL63_11085 [Nesterenkonia jeotgali]
MSSLDVGNLLFTLLIYSTLVAILAQVLHAVIRSAVRKALRDHDSYRREQTQTADRIRSQPET